MKELERLLWKVNYVTSCHRHGTPISKKRMDDLCNAQIDYEEAVRENERKKN